MDVNKAIEFLRSEKRNIYYQNTVSAMEGKENLDVIIALLQRGEKYKAVVKELENCLLPEQYKIVEDLEQKYFPK